MPTKLFPLSVLSPGFKGLNTQNVTIEDPHFAARATNAVIDNAGRLAARKGWTALTSSPLAGTPGVRKIAEHIDTAGTSTIISAANQKLYSGTTTLTDITGSLTPATNNWKFQKFNGKLLAWQDGESPIVWTGSGNFAAITPAAGGSIPSGDECLAAFGRIWATKSGTDKTVIRYSDILDETTFEDATTPGDAGTLDLKAAQGWGNDTIVALREHNGLLVIFGKNHIAMYKGAWNPNNTGLSYTDAEFELVDIIQGVGALGRDVVTSIGTDLIFLSETGLRSLQRTIQERSLPLTEISKNVRDDLLTNVAGESVQTMELVYNDKEGFVLLNLESSGFVYVFDVRLPLQDGTFRATKWDSITPKAMFSARDGTLYFGQAGVVAHYDSYQDDTTAYFLDYRNAWTSLADEVQNRYKIPKNARVLTYAGGGYDLDLRIYFDYEDNFVSSTATIPEGGIAEFGVSEFGEDEFNSLGDNNELEFYPEGFGRTLQFGFYCEIDGNALAIQRLIILLKLGREA